MTLAAARVTLKLHRFEIGAALLVAVVFTSWALVVELRTALVEVPGGCLDAWRAAGPLEAGACSGPMRAWGAIVSEEGTRIVEAMAYVPFGVGLLGGAPIVAAELESRTAQTAWALYASRFRWLLHQLAPTLAVLGLAMVALSIGTAIVERDRVFFGYSPVEDIGLSGFALLPRWWAALGFGLFAGSLIGRTLPAFVLGIAATAVLIVFVAWTHEEWLQRQSPTVLAEQTSGPARRHDAIVTAVAWRGPTGDIISSQEALALAHAAGTPQPGAGDPQDDAALAWLEEHGYAEVDLGISSETALHWAIIEGLVFTLVGFGALGATAWEVRRRRPT
jgi:hypothetical protein